MAVQMRIIIGFENGGTNIGHLFHFAAYQFSVAGALLKIAQTQGRSQFFFPKKRFFFQKLCICAKKKCTCARFFSFYNTYLNSFVNFFLKKSEKKSCTYAKKKSCTYAKIKKKLFFRKLFLRPSLFLSDFKPPEVGFSKNLTVWEFSASREYINFLEKIRMKQFHTLSLTWYSATPLWPSACHNPFIYEFPSSSPPLTVSALYRIGASPSQPSTPPSHSYKLKIHPESSLSRLPLKSVALHTSFLSASLFSIVPIPSIFNCANSIDLQLLEFFLISVSQGVMGIEFLVLKTQSEANEMDGKITIIPSIVIKPKWRIYRASVANVDCSGKIKIRFELMYVVHETDKHKIKRRSLMFRLGSFENSYIPENPRTPPISYISQTVIPFKKPTSGTSKTGSSMLVSIFKSYGILVSLTACKCPQITFNKDVKVIKQLVLKIISPLLLLDLSIPASRFCRKRCHRRCLQIELPPATAVVVVASESNNYRPIVDISAFEIPVLNPHVYMYTELLTCTILFKFKYWYRKELEVLAVQFGAKTANHTTYAN
ncbi:hypothetical protein LXL04_031552 [Taraxacum kok-saghyz]